MAKKKVEKKMVSLYMDKSQYDALVKLSDKRNEYVSPMCVDILMKSAKRNGIEVVV